MIRPIDIRLNAAHPDYPLAEAVTFTGAPSTVLIRGVPPNCGRWAITAVFVAATFPDGSTTTRAAVQSANGVWVATLPATATSGRTANGLRVLADGIDENGEAVTGYILGVADFAVASLGVTPAPQPGETSWQMLYFDAVPSTLRKGDVAKVDGDLKFYDGTAWVGFSAESISNLAEELSRLADNLAVNYYTAEETDEAIDKLAAYYITADAQGNPFATHAALVNAQTYYSGGSLRTPTRNDYAVVSADETHGGAEWRYIYAVDAQGVGQWEPQYAVEGVIAYDDAVTRTSANGVKSSGIWSAIWGALSALPTGVSSLYDWCVAQLGLKRDYTDLSYDTTETVEVPALRARFKYNGQTLFDHNLICTEEIPDPPVFIHLYKWVESDGSSEATAVYVTQMVSALVTTWTLYSQLGEVLDTVQTSNSGGLYPDFTFSTEAGIDVDIHKTTAQKTVTVEDTIALESKVYTKSQVDTLLAGKVPNSRTVNGQPLSSDVTLTGEDIPAFDGSSQSVWNAISSVGSDAAQAVTKADAAVDTANGVAGAFTQHADNTTIHVSAAEKSTWNGKQNALSQAQLDNIAAIPNKANRVANPTAGNLAALDANGNPTDAGYRFEVRNGIPYIIETTND